LDSTNFNRDVVLKRIRRFIRVYQSDLSFAHGFDHAERVCKLALFISEKEGGDPIVLEIAALIHDIGIVPLAALKRELMVGDSNKEHRIFFENYFTGTENHADLGARIARNLLKEMELPEEKIEHICAVIREHNKPSKSSLESKILNDADVLERYGATWIARAFQRTNAFDKRLSIETVIDRYLQPSGRPRHTKTAQRMMEKRMAFQNNFIKQFIDELELRS